jgi:hypothetical protein
VVNAHRIRLEPTMLTVEPGREATCTVRITNLGDVVDSFTVQVLGAAAAWTTVEPQTVNLFPAAEGVARLTFRPPRTSQVPAGTTPFAVRVQSQDARLETSVVEEGAIEVGRFTDIAAELLPRTSRGRFSGRHRVQVSNRGNAPAVVRMSGSDAEQAVDLSFRPQALPVQAGTIAGAGVRARATRTAWTGQARQWAFQVTAEADATAPVQMQGVLEQRPVIGRWTGRTIALAAVGLVALTLLHYKGAELQSAAANFVNGNRAAQVSPGPPTPAGDVSPSSAPTAAAQSPTPSPSASSGGTGGTGGTGAGAPAIVPAAVCAANAITLGAAAVDVPIPGLAVTLDNGSTSRTALVSVSANLGVDADAEVRVAYSVDGGSVAENVFGPANLANAQQYYETRAVTAVIPLGPGSHSIAAFWRVSGAAGKLAHMDRRCLIVKSAVAGPPDANPVVAAATCAGSAITYSSPNGFQPIPGMTVTVNNGSSARQALVSVSANLGVDVDAEVRLAYSVDGGAPQENVYGPSNLANHQQYYEGRAVTAVIPLGAGTHTVAAQWRVSGSAGKTAYMDKRCLTVESAIPGTPSSQVVTGAACAGGAITATASATGQPMLGMSVTVNNGTVSRQALVSVSANLGVDPDAEVRLAYSIDGGGATENTYGPANFANHQQYYEGRAATAVIPLGPGTHTIAAYWRVSGAAGRAAYGGDRRCLIVESIAG